MIRNLILAGLPPRLHSSNDYGTAGMNLKAAFLTIAAGGALLLVTACGGSDVGETNGSDASGDNSNTTSASSGGSNGSTTTVPVVPTQAASNSSNSGVSSSICQRVTETTFIGGNLFVAEQGPIGVTLLSDGGLSKWALSLLYDDVHGIPTSNQQDKWGAVALFAPGTPVGTSTQVEVLPPTYFGFVLYGPVPTTFPRGVSIELHINTNGGAFQGASEDNSVSTASIGKDIVHPYWPRARVTYGPNNTATVTFFGSFSVALTNVFGTGCPPMPAQP